MLHDMHAFVALVICLYNSIETHMALGEGYNWQDSTLRTLEFYLDTPPQRMTNKGRRRGSGRLKDTTVQDHELCLLLMRTTGH